MRRREYDGGTAPKIFFGRIPLLGRRWLHPTERGIVRFDAAVGLNMQSGAAATVPEQPACPPDTDTELQLAIYQLAHRSAWGRCFSAQHLAIHEDQVEEIYLMQAAAKKVSREAMSGRPTIRGRPSDGIDYESIPREHWRSVFLDVTPDMVTPWKVFRQPGATAKT